MASPQSSQLPPNSKVDSLFSFEAGMNAGESPLLLNKNELAWASNATNRGTLLHPRPARRILTLDFGGNTAVQTAVATGLWQGGTYYKPDSGPETLVASISGRLYQFTPIGTTATVQDVTGANPQSATALQCWLWQAENYVFWNDGINLPVYFDGTTTARSNGVPGPPPGNVFEVAVPFQFPAHYDGVTLPPPPSPPPNGQTITFRLTSPYTGSVLDQVTLSPGTVSPLNGTVISIGVPTANDITVQFALRLVNSSFG